MGNKFNELIQQIVADYFHFCNCGPINLSIIFSDDIWETYLEIRPDHRSKLPAQRPSFNGTIAPPLKLDGTFTVIVDNQYFLRNVENSQLSWIGTITHEITHVRDYKEYAQIVSATNYDEVLTADHRMFQLWTEFNAKRHGYYFLRKYSFDDITDPAQLPDIINTELPGQISYMSNEYSSTTDGWHQLYTVSQFLGRLAVWEDLFPTYFTADFITSLLAPNPWMYDLYEYLNKHRELKEAINSFDELHEIALQNFPGI